MKTLGQLLGASLLEADAPLAETPIFGVTLDSRTVKPGDLFFAVAGAKLDARSFIPAAVSAGAAAVAIEGDSRSIQAHAGAALGTVIGVRDIRAACAMAAAEFYDRPSEKLLTIGVTGTNGKTSVTWILAESLARLGAPTVHVGTLGMRVVSMVPTAEISWRSIPNTSPDPISFQSFLAEGVAIGARNAVSEVTSQGLLQARTAEVAWDAAVFTNLTRDHLDLHGSMQAYSDAKAKLFLEELVFSTKPRRVATINCADPVGAELASRLRKEHPDLKVVSFSTAPAAETDGALDAFVVEARCSLDRTEIDCVVFGVPLKITSRLIGAFNVENLLAAAATLLGLGFPAAEVSRAIASVPQVPGRLEVAKPASVSVVIDYAHTPDALVKAQRSLREIGAGRLITVFGCGGDRDRGKRPLMGAAVAEYSDVAVVTSDNPRSEDPARIIDDILPGISIDLQSGRRCGRVYALPDRREALREAIRIAAPGDTVLVAGKGHEDYQEAHGVRTPFSDIEICRELVDELLSR